MLYLQIMHCLQNIYRIDNDGELIDARKARSAGRVRLLAYANIYKIQIRRTHTHTHAQMQAQTIVCIFFSYLANI